MSAAARITLLSLVLGLSACALQPPAPQSSEPIPPQPGTSQPSAPHKAPQPVPQHPAPGAPQTSAHFAPPPGGNSHWDSQLGVYVLDDQPDTFYRQRTYYRWDNGWSWSTARNGPWQATDVNGVPPGLGRQFGH
ncbi:MULTISPECIES: hypothetical protein [unclassified Pseudomonas]|uniref:hypothetical protein n=1 Tax=unclassified Pseudomonas TaxID=196821 RepID=UPI002AC926AA|nr:MULTISPECIES: hypothetical protein [unclassified Pseudomonas]MEB0043044.1 hypothetical protein [Pseudomonas sp. MH10]MEB0121007.1 hypothetical protein [Pseudomonas sp. CCI1.2]WPX64336.1 hypothetical protein RHM59_01185 [Pseudomonas sp. MH10]